MKQLHSTYEKYKSQRNKRLLLLIGILIGFLVFSLWFMQIDTMTYLERLQNVPVVLRRMMGIDWAVMPELLLQTLTTFFLVLISLSIALVSSYILAFLAAENTTPFLALAAIVKAVITIIRSVPNLILGLIVIASIGFGNTPAIIIMSIVGTAQLTRFFIGSIEEIGFEEIEALQTTGASRIQVIVHGILPVVQTAFLSWITIQVENTISLSISLGVLGIQGIGMLLTDAQASYKFTTITTIILYIFIFMFFLEWIMTRVREIING